MTIANKKAYNAQNNGHLPMRPPNHLGRIASAMWRKVVPFIEEHAPTERIDANLVEMYCTQYEIYRDAYESIKDSGIQTEIYKTIQNAAGEKIGVDFVGYKRNPATSVYNDANKQLIAIGAQLGLSPKSRAEMMQIQPEDDKTDVAAAMKQFLGGEGN
ncbi:phage terminase small subunit P27 family [Lactobacillus rhamnosus]|uniref:Phage terminase small subunit P27 family n=1 Tax=Lacticaseibacillus rhamnosus TaxID=47715 RepID=A0A7Y7QGW8_LACRH|nr:phage terminase small subunit P27 family [Lacticaseibacillus rhamnosus]NVO88941.1 phage terminase small subunit P27 family [Lacticaseibacillus rhamnosus]